MSLLVFAFAIAFFFAMNIGASGAAASMGIAYGSGAVKKKKHALWISAIFVFLGAALGGGEVVKTIGSGIIPKESLTIAIVSIILSSATLSLALANYLGIPLSTSEVTVGSVVGIGIALQNLYVQKLMVIVSFWIIVPIVAFTLAYIIGILLRRSQGKIAFFAYGNRSKWVLIFVVGAGAFEAFSAGMNNVANAVGPLVGAGLMDATLAIWVGGAFVALGAVFFGGRVLQTNGKKITRLSLIEGGFISATGGLLVTVASIFGLPVPLTQVTTSAIMGIGAVHNGNQLWQKHVIQQMLRIWIVSPVVSLVISYFLFILFVKQDFYTALLLLSVIVAVLGIMSLMMAIQRERNEVNDEGSGI